MTSYMVYKPLSVLKQTTPHGRPRMVNSLETSALMTSLNASPQNTMKPQEGKTPSEGAPDVPCPTPRSASAAAMIALNPGSGVHTARKFEHDIPDHILQAWPLVHQVHSRKTDSRSSDTINDGPLPTTALTRHRTRNSQGVYRSSVLTPGEVEFMARKREARRRAAVLQERRATRSCTEYSGNNGNKAFVTQDAQTDGGSDLSRDQYSRMTVDSRASIVPSTVEMSLPPHRQRQEALRRLRRQDQHLRLAGSSLGTETVSEGHASPTSALLGREKASGNNIRRFNRTRGRRRGEQRQKDQQLILGPSSEPDWYEAQGLTTPSVLHKYLSDSFYSAASGKPGVDTSVLLNYIRHKQKNATYVPPPPSSGSNKEQEEEEEDEDYQEVRMDANGQVHSISIEDTPQKSISCENLSMKKSQGLPSLYSHEHHTQNQGHEDQLRERSSAPRRTLKENGCFDLLVGGDRLGAGHMTRSLGNGEWPVTAVSNLQIGQQQAQLGNKQPAKPLPLVSVESTTPETDTTTADVVEVLQEHEKEKYVEEPVVITQQELNGEISDNTKKITVVLPSSDISIKTTDDQ